MKEPITVVQAAAILGKSKRTVLNYIQDGLLPAEPVGVQLLIERRDLERFRDNVLPGIKLGRPRKAPVK